jgi:N-acetylglucosaminyldiphosphoundecaprenol N-acetyl-beta-D-mannosaminyltransferase
VLNKTTELTSKFESVSFLGITVHPTTISDLLNLVRDAITRGNKSIIANHNLHSLYLFHRLPELQRFFKAAAWTHIDGMAMVLLGRMYGHRIRGDQRVTYVDWTGPLMESAVEGEWRIFYLGSKPGVAQLGASRLRHKYPGLRIRSTHGYLEGGNRTEEDKLVIEAINAYKPHILMVGMGMPRQELWIQEHLSRISANVILPVGATIDYAAGAVPTPPRWAGRLCLEWAFRLASDPLRLWRRYLLEPFFLLKIMSEDLRAQGWRTGALPHAPAEAKE